MRKAAMIKNDSVTDFYKFLNCFPDLTEEGNDFFKEFKHTVHPFTNSSNKKSKTN